MSKYTIITLEEAHSTNAYALEYMPFLDDRTVIYTSRQTSGRGRYNRKWIGDDSSNLYMSIVLKPEKTDNYPFANLTQYLSVVLCNVLEKEFDFKSSIKWPNDILVKNSKISGILAETYLDKGAVKGVALGLGLNVNLKEETINKIDQKAVSIFTLKHQNYDTEKILRLICDDFFEHYDDFIKNGFGYIKDEYIKRCSFLGSNITIKEADKQKKYFAKSIDDNGLLIAVDEFNNECKIITGDILC